MKLSGQIDLVYEMVSEVFDTISTSPFIFNKEVFELWIKGLSSKFINISYFSILIHVWCSITIFFNASTFYFNISACSLTLFIFCIYIIRNLVDEAARKLQSQGDVEIFNLSFDLLVSYVADQYAQFTLLESALARPDVFISYPSNSIVDLKLRHKLVERFVQNTSYYY